MSFQTRIISSARIILLSTAIQVCKCEMFLIVNFYFQIRKKIIHECSEKVIENLHCMQCKTGTTAFYLYKKLKIFYKA